MENRSDNFENDDISRLLGSLKQVDTPADFDVRVRARIAQGKPSEGRAWIFAPAAATLLVMVAVGYLGFRSYNSPSLDQASVVPSLPVQSETAPEPQVTLSAPAPVIETKDTVAETGPPPSKPSNKKDRVSVPHKPAKPEDGAGSLDIAVGISEPLSGAETDSGTVREVKQNSAAERSGLKPGDVIVGRSGDTLRVRRNGKIIEIKLKR